MAMMYRTYTPKVQLNCNFQSILETDTVKIRLDWVKVFFLDLAKNYY